MQDARHRLDHGVSQQALWTVCSFLEKIRRYLGLLAALLHCPLRGLGTLRVLKVTTLGDLELMATVYYPVPISLRSCCRFPGSAVAGHGMIPSVIYSAYHITVKWEKYRNTCF